MTPGNGPDLDLDAPCGMLATEMAIKVFKISRVSGAPVSDTELLADLRRVAERLGKNTVGQKEYRRLGTFDDSTVGRRFGSWNDALRRAGLGIANQVDLADEMLFDNILTLWAHYGRQPRRRELALPPSRISQSPYSRRFGSWSAALAAFVRFAEEMPAEGEAPVPATHQKRTPRDPSLRLRFRVMQRDHFTCRACGASPAKSRGVELHVDHVAPWSKGGETTHENLQTLCSRCNQGKSDLT
jgi:hypothetical protein